MFKEEFQPQLCQRDQLHSVLHCIYHLIKCPQKEVKNVFKIEMKKIFPEQEIRNFSIKTQRSGSPPPASELSAQKKTGATLSILLRQAFIWILQVRSLQEDALHRGKDLSSPNMRGESREVSEEALSRKPLAKTTLIGAVLRVRGVLL